MSSQIVEDNLRKLLVAFQIDQLVEDWEDMIPRIKEIFVAEGFCDK